MSINAVSNSLLPYNGPLSIGGQAAAQSTARNRESASATSQAQTASKAFELEAEASGHPDAAAQADRDELAEDVLDRARQQSRVASGTSSAPTTDSGIARFSPAIGLYNRVSQYSDSGQSVSGLMKSWNDIVQEAQFEPATVAHFVRSVAQNPTLGFQSGILHLTV